VPDKLSVVGFDDITISSHTVPALTTSRMPIGKIISYAIDLAVSMARDPGRRRDPLLEVFTPELIIRESTAAAPRGRAR
jgi:DNA-binding LacI/PurR family transcriptional regulator